LAVPTNRGWCIWRAPSPMSLDMRPSYGRARRCRFMCASMRRRRGPSQFSPGGESHGAMHSGRATVVAPQGEVLPGTARSGISLMNLKIGDSETPKSRITAITDNWRLLKARNVRTQKIPQFLVAVPREQSVTVSLSGAVRPTIRVTLFGLGLCRYADFSHCSPPPPSITLLANDKNGTICIHPGSWRSFSS